jgi:hypothetical protein
LINTLFHEGKPSRFAGDGQWISELLR